MAGNCSRSWARNLRALTRDAIKNANIDITFHRLGSMFCLFFASAPIIDLASAQRSDLKMFGSFFHACLKRGIYFAPSQFETGFISTAHSAERHRAHGRCRARSIGESCSDRRAALRRCALQARHRLPLLLKLCGVLCDRTKGTHACERKLSNSTQGEVLFRRRQRNFSLKASRTVRSNRMRMEIMSAGQNSSMPIWR